MTSASLILRQPGLPYAIITMTQSGTAGSAKWQKSWASFARTDPPLITPDEDRGFPIRAAKHLDF
jgi:hypothetical protein